MKPTHNEQGIRITEWGGGKINVDSIKFNFDCNYQKPLADNGEER